MKKEKIITTEKILLFTSWLALGIALPVTAVLPTSFATRNLTCHVLPSKKQNKQTLFANKDAQYRIPSIVECKSGKLIAFCDHRYQNKDIGGGRRLDIVIKTSTDGGKVWSNSERIIAQGGSNIVTDFNCAHGDAATVVDRETGQILMLCASGGIGFWESSREHPLMMGRYYSDDEGKTWKGEEITHDIYNLVPDVNEAFFTSGRICQSSRIKIGSHYRIYSVLVTRTGNRVLYSDNFGKQWYVLGQNVAESAPKGDEAKIEELPNGDVLLSSRVQDGRYFNIYHYDDQTSASGAWNSVAYSSSKANGIIAKENACNGEVLLVKAKKNGTSTWLLLQSTPIGPKRTNVAIFYKELKSAADYASSEAIAKDWEGYYQVSDTTSAYSTMIQGKKGQIFFLYEENAFRHPETEPDDYFDIQFACLSIKQITNNKYE